MPSSSKAAQPPDSDVSCAVTDLEADAEPVTDAELKAVLSELLPVPAPKQPSAAAAAPRRADGPSATASSSTPRSRPPETPADKLSARLESLQHAQLNAETAGEHAAALHWFRRSRALSRSLEDLLDTFPDPQEAPFVPSHSDVPSSIAQDVGSTSEQMALVQADIDASKAKYSDAKARGDTTTALQALRRVKSSNAELELLKKVAGIHVG
jgi:hypothetical protein